MSLVHVRAGVVLRDDAARSFRRLELDLGRRVDVNRTTETWDQQMQRHLAYLAYRAGTGPWAPYAVHPRDSNHVYKTTTDTGGTAWDTDERGATLVEHGWIADVAGEPWHREYRPHLDRHRFDPEPANTTATALYEEDEMDTRSIITVSSKATKFELLRGSKRSIGKAEWDAMREVESAGGPKLAVAIVSQATLDAIPGK